MPDDPRNPERLSVAIEGKKPKSDKRAVMSEQACALCCCPFVEWGNTAEPVANGRCCNVCSDLYVIPARIRRMRHEKAKDIEDPETGKRATVTKQPTKQERAIVRQ